MKTYIISIMSKDRAGIVAGVTQAIYDLGGDVADVKQSLLYGYFTMILAARFDGDVSKDELREKIAVQKGANDWEISIITANEPLKETLANDDNYVITVAGDNRRGIVNRVSVIFAAHKINVIDLETKLHDGVYVLATQVDISRADCSLADLKDELQRFADSNQMRVTIQHNDIFRATNDIRL